MRRSWDLFPEAHVAYFWYLIFDALHFAIYRIQPNYRPCPYNSPDFLLYFHPLDDLLALEVENKFM